MKGIGQRTDLHLSNPTCAPASVIIPDCFVYCHFVADGRVLDLRHRECNHKLPSLFTGCRDFFDVYGRGNSSDKTRRSASERTDLQSATTKDPFEGMPDMPNMPDFPLGGNRPEVTGRITQGTICACDTHLCNAGGRESSQTSDSRNLIVICVLAVSALITFSENYDVNI